MNSPYNEALGATLIERTKRERIVLVGVTMPGHHDDDTEAGLDELSLLIDTAGADEAGRGCSVAIRPITPGTSARARWRSCATCAWPSTPTPWCSTTS